MNNEQTTPPTIEQLREMSRKLEFMVNFMKDYTSIEGAIYAAETLSEQFDFLALDMERSLARSAKRKAARRRRAEALSSSHGEASGQVESVKH